MTHRATDSTTDVAVFRLGDLARWSLATTLAVSAIGSLVTGALYGTNAGVLCLLGTTALLTTSSPLIARPELSVVEPLWFVILAVAIGVTGKAYYLVFGRTARIDFLLQGAAPADLIPAAAIIAIAMLCFAGGYAFGELGLRLPLPARVRSESWSPVRLAALAAALVLGALTCLVLLLPETTGPGIGSWLSAKRFVRVPGSEHLGAGGYLRWGAAQVSTAFLLVFTYWVAKRATASRALTAGVLATGVPAITAAVFFNSRRDLVFMIFAVLIIWTCLRREPSARVAIGGAVLTVGLSSIMMLFRAIADPALTAERLRTGLVVESTVGGRHFLDLTKTALIFDAFPQRLDHYWGQTFFQWMLAPIPRSWWPAKPAIGVGKDLGPALFGTGSSTGVPPGIIGELHLNFGLVGVFLGMAVVGVLLRTLYAGFASGFPNKSFVLLYAVVAPHAAFGAVTMDVSGTMAALLQDLIPILAAIAICADPDSSVVAADRQAGG